MANPSPAFSLPRPQTKIETEDPDEPSYLHSACSMEASSSVAASTSTAVDPSSCNYDCYDIFISHRGPELKKSFASILYLRLLSYGLRVFLDQQELQRGKGITPQIKDAITTASVNVAIFSLRYAESNWCLEELVHMLESKRIIIPVFYEVRPDELRWTRGTADGRYAQDLRKLEKKTTCGPQGETLRYDSTTVENWRHALERVAGISGFELEAYNRDEGVLLEKVVKRVLETLKISDLYVAKYPTGLHEKVKDFENKVLLPQQESGKAKSVGIVGIVGSVGVGKTTLAKQVFNQKSSYYARSCFLLNVRQNAAKGLLKDLQSELLKKLYGLDTHIYSVEEGKNMLETRLFSRHVLIILDDVDNVDQVNALLPDPHFLHKDSLIVITSRDKSFLTSLISLGVKDSAIYKLTGLKPQHSKELFCFHAFDSPHPPPGFGSVVEKFLDTCDGLPLSLKVLGAHLCGKELSDWNHELDKLEKRLHDGIFQILKVSYDALEVDVQQIFLDIVWFFIGENKDMAIKIWQGSGWEHGSSNFKILENKCLVEVDSGNNIQMHDHLRDMGRRIEEASTSTRLIWRKTQSIDDLLQQNLSGRTEVRGIRNIDPFFGSDVSWYESWKRTLFNILKITDGRIGAKKLQLLDIEGGQLEAILRRVHSTNLIWLRWSNCPSNSLPSWIPLEKLRVLHVFGSDLATLWQNESKAPLELRELVIVGPLLSLPKSIGLLKELELIVLNCRTSNLERLPDEFCSLLSLKRFELTNCSKIKSLPYSFGDLKNLQHIDLSHSYYLQTLPKSFADLIRLKYLDLSYCYNLTMSSETLGNIRTLEYIDFSYCTKIETLPPQVASQRFLRYLYFSGTNLKELPVAIGDLRALELLVLECPFLEMLPSSLGNLTNLKELKLRYCKRLNCLPDSVGLLNRMTVYDCAFRELSFQKVEEETERQSRGKRISSNLDSSPRLQINREIPEKSFPGLQHLLVGFCNDLVEVGTLPNTLITLQLKCCYNLKKIEGLGSLVKLQTLDISGCTELEELPRIDPLLALVALDAYGCVKLNSIRGLAHLTNLRVLDVSGCSELKVLHGVSHLAGLRRFDYSECPKLRMHKELHRLGSVFRLDAIEFSLQ